MADDRIPVARPWLGEEEAEAARRVILSGWVTQGPEVAAFEREFAAYVGAPHACAVSNCTAGLQLALRAAGAGQGDEVVTVSHSFIATAAVVRHAGAIPVFVDVRPGTYNLDPALLEASLSARTRAILCVHQMGMPCDLPAILAVARRHGLPVIEDAACAAGSEIRWDGAWEKIGQPHGDVACFSFHPRKVITAGEGGLLTTSNPEWDRRFRLWRQHGMTVADTARHEAGSVIFESYAELGYNCKMTDIQAAVARVQVRRLPEMARRRRAQADRYRELLADCPEITLPEEPEWARSNWQSFCVRLAAGASQQRVMERMLAQGVATRRGVMCSHLEPAFDGEPWTAAGGSLAHSEAARDRGLILPLFHAMTDDQQERVARALKQALEAKDAG